MNTQSKKLAAVLRFGFLSTLTKAEAIKKGFYNEKDFAGKSKLFQVVEFTPYSDDSELEHTMQLTDNPFTLIDIIFQLL